MDSSKGSSSVGIQAWAKQEWPKFKDLGGMNNQLELVKQYVILPMEQAEVFKKLNFRRIVGVLLHGPHGCGKTMLAHAIANETTRPFYELSATLGTFPQTNSDVFSQTLSNAPSVVFIDDLDDIALGSHRGLLVPLMKECRDRHVIVIGAVEQPNLLSRELIGLFTINIHIGLPDEVSRMEIVPLMVRRLEAEGYNLGERFDDESVKFVAQCTQGYSCAKLKEFLRKLFSEH